MALTGIGAFAYVVLHLAGNCVVWKGQDTFNTYARTLHALPFLPALEAALAMVFTVHILLALVLTWQNYCARPVRNTIACNAGAKTLASTTMIYTGLIVMGFMLFHMWNVRFGPGREVPVFERVRNALIDPHTAVVYLVGLTALGIHISHGLSSSLLSLGLRHPRHDAWVDLLGRFTALVVATGFVAIVLWFLLTGGPHGHA
jgi:succinate dehydrogenase / fumarate reductase cytochrome b subunit